MTIRSDKNNTVGVMMLFACLVCLIVLLYAVSRSVLLAVAVGGVPLFSLILLYWISTGRTLVMDEQGCTVRFLCFRRTHRWESLQEKSVADYKDISHKPMPYHGGVIFSSRKMKNAGASHPVYFSALRPFSSFYVYFSPKHTVGENSYVKLYTVEESTFRDKLASWGVVLDGDGAVERAAS